MSAYYNHKPDCPANAFHGCDSATCDRPCIARAAEINARQRAAMAEFNWLKAIGAGFAVGLITLAVLYCVAALVEQAGENIRQTQIQNERV